MRIILNILIVILSGCLSLKPTPILFSELTDANNKAVHLYSECLENNLFTPTKEGCSVDQLDASLLTVRKIAKDFISADIRQPQGYNIFLKNTVIYFAVGIRATYEYTEAEKIAEQFFTVQKATSGKHKIDAAYYWVIMMAERLAHRVNTNSLDEAELADLNLSGCIDAGFKIMEALESGHKKSNLVESLRVLLAIRGNHA